MTKRKNKEMKVIKLVRKSNQLVEARYKFDIWETRIFTKMLTMIHKDDEDFQSYRIYMTDVIKEFGMENSRSSYDRLKAGGVKLMRKIIKVVINSPEDGLVELTTPIVIGMKNPLDGNNEDAKYIDISFHPDMKPFLLSLKSQFTTYDVQNILKLPSTYSIRIYELLKQYERIGRRKFTVRELKEIIGVMEEVDNNGKKSYADNYPLYGNFRQRVLLKAQKDLKKYTDIYFEFDPIKRGRKVVELIFHIYPNQVNKQKKTKTKEPESIDFEKVEPKENNAFNELFPKVKKWIGEGSFKKLLENHPENQVRNAIQYTLNRLKRGDEIANVAGHIVAMTKQTSLFDSTEKKKKEVSVKKEMRQQNEAKKSELEAHQKELYRELRQKENAVIEVLFIEMPEIRNEILDEVKANRFSQYDSEKSDEENLKDPMFSAAFRNAIRKKFSQKFEALDRMYQPKIKAIKEMIRDL